MVPQHNVTNDRQPDEHHSVQELGPRSRTVFGLSRCSEDARQIASRAVCRRLKVSDTVR